MRHIVDPSAACLPLPGYDVVIPCYNRARFVDQAVASVLAQSHRPGRVIVVDDGSADESAAVIAALADGSQGRVTAVALPRNGGVSNARNVGVALCRSPWIAFLDSDDVWLPGAAEALLAASSAADVVCGHFHRVEPGGDPGPPECGWWGDDIRVALQHGGVIGPSWSVVRRRMVGAVRGFDPTFHNCNDWDFYTRAAAAGAVFQRVDTAVALYRTVPGHRLVNDTAIGSENARRVRAHAYLRTAAETAVGSSAINALPLQ